MQYSIFWNARDLERKLKEFGEYYNRHRAHESLGGGTPAQASDEVVPRRADPRQFQWQGHCRGLFELPMAA